MHPTVHSSSYRQTPEHPFRVLKMWWGRESGGLRFAATLRLFSGNLFRLPGNPNPEDCQLEPAGLPTRNPDEWFVENSQGERQLNPKGSQREAGG